MQKKVKCDGPTYRQKVTNNDKQWQKMTHKGPYSCFKTDVIAKNKLFSLQIAQKCKKK